MNKLSAIKGELRAIQVWFPPNGPQGLTPRIAVLLTMFPDVAVILVVEVEATIFGVARPVASIVATRGLEEFQVTAFVMSSCCPFCRMPIAWNCWV
jgi:hypothetical protein